MEGDRSRRGPTARSFAMAAVVCLLLVLGWLCLRDRQYLLVDDAYIAFRYAANLADGHGLVWNPGERVEGYTNPLWVVLLAAIATSKLDLTIPALCLCMGFAVATVLLLAKITQKTVAGAPVLVTVLPSFLLVINQSFAHAATSGMESTAFGFFVLLGIYWLVMGREKPDARRWAALSFSAAYLTRPEGVLVVAVALSVEFLSSPGPFQARLRALLPIGATVALVVAAHVALRFTYYGYLLPNTFYAKVILGRPTMMRGAAHIAGFMLAGGLLVLPGLLELGRSGPSRPFILHGYSLLFVYLAYLFFIGGDILYWHRFYVPLLPLPLLATTELAVRVAGEFRQKALAPLPRGAWAVTLASTVLGVTIVMTALGYSFGERRFLAGRIDPALRGAMVRVARFFHQEVRPGSLIAAAAVGHVSYYNRQLYVLDMWGLNDAHIAHLDAPAAVGFGHDKVDIGYVVSRKPDYVYVPQDPSAPIILPGYEICWSELFLSIYRRTLGLNENEGGLGVPAPQQRFPGPLPPCRLPNTAAERSIH